MSERDEDMLLRRAAAIFREVIEEEPARRAALLDDRCRSDDALRARVESMLALDGRRECQHASGATAGPGDTAALPGIPAIAGGFDTNVLRDMAASPVASDLDRSGRPLVPGDRVGRYVIERKIAEGGSSIVYEASQSEPARRVALKVHRFAILSADGLARFREETKILGHLRHAGIAHVYDASIGDGAASEVGAAHWIAMELVPDGMPLTRYCQTHALEMRGRLELFRTVCDAVAHAHQRGVIHRDLKPANILVGSDGVPKVIDFGLGRLLDASAATRVTLHGQIFGTMEYMSPEQCAGNAMDVDVRSDVYGLGLCLYELVFDQRARDFAGRTPFDALHEVSQSTIHPPASTGSSVPRDLQTIVMHAVEKERSDRYQSVQALADDLGRFLRAEPIQGRPSGVMRRLQLFALRNKLVAALLMIASATLIAFLVTVPALARSARLDREEAARMLSEHKQASEAVTAYSLRRNKSTRVAAMKDVVGSELAGDHRAADAPLAEPDAPYFVEQLGGDNLKASRGVAVVALPDDHGRRNELALLDRQGWELAVMDLNPKPPIDVVGSASPPPLVLESALLLDLLPAHAGDELLLKFSNEGPPGISAVLILDLNLEPLCTAWTSGLIRNVVWDEPSQLLAMSLVTGALGSFEPRFAAFDARMCVGAGSRMDSTAIVLAVEPEAFEGTLLPARGREPTNLIRPRWAKARIPREFEDNEWQGHYTVVIAEAADGDADAVAGFEARWHEPDAKWKWSNPKPLYSGSIDANGEFRLSDVMQKSRASPAPPQFVQIDFSQLQVAASLPRDGLDAIVEAIHDPDDAEEIDRRVSEAPPPFAHHPEVVRSVVETMCSNWRDLHRIAYAMMQREAPAERADLLRKSLALAEHAQEIHDRRCPCPDECVAACYSGGVLAEALFLNGRIADALKRLERVESTWRMYPIPQDPIELALTLGWKARCLAELGRSDEARTALADARNEAMQYDRSSKQFEQIDALLERAAEAIAASANDPPP